MPNTPIISFILEAEGLEPWLVAEAKTQKINKSFTFDTFPADGYVVVADSDDIAAYAFEKLDFNVPVVWFGYQYEDAISRGAEGFPFKNDELDADDIYAAAKKLIDLLSTSHQELAVTAEKKSKIRFPTRTGGGKKVEIIPAKLIAVGGFPGTGSSFVAWNLAQLQAAVLVEGRTTGSLYEWIKDDTRLRDAAATGHKYALVSDEPVPNVSSLFANGETIVIDVGSDLENQYWKSAPTKIWVTTLDPQWPELPAEATSIVLNKFPDGWAIDPDEILSRSPDLTVRECGREVLLACLQGKPWITKQPEEIKAMWNDLVGNNSPSGAAAAHSEEWE